MCKSKKWLAKKYTCTFFCPRTWNKVEYLKLGQLFMKVENFSFSKIQLAIVTMIFLD